MTKKSYQKRLPTVLPARPAAPPPRVPAARLPADDVPKEAPPEHVVAPDPAPDDRPPQASAPTRPAVPVLVLAAVALVLVALVAGRPLIDGSDDPAADRTPPSDVVSSAPRSEGTSLAAGESLVFVRVLDSGQVVVHQRMRLAEPLERVRLAPPTIPGEGPVSATGVRIVADDAPVAGPRALPERGATYSLDPATHLDLRYRLRGAVQRSPSVEGRALALATSLVVRGPLTSKETRTVSASRVLALACAPATGEAAAPCGRASSDDLWIVELTGDRVADRLVAQVELG